MTHVFEPNGGFIGGPDSIHAGARRQVAVCSRPGCTAFRRDNGSYGRLDTMDDAPRSCAFAPTHAPPIALSDPNEWSIDEWRAAVSDLRRPSQQELEFMSLRQKMTEGKGTPASFTTGSTRASPIEGVKALADFVEGIQSLAAPVPGEGVHGRFNSPVLRLCDREGSLIIADRTAEFARKRESDVVQLHLHDGTKTMWAWNYFRRVNEAYNQHLRSLPATADVPSFVDVLATRFQWPAEADDVVNLQALRVKAYLVYILAILNPAKYAGSEANFFNRSFAQVTDTYYRKTILGKANLSIHVDKQDGRRKEAGPAAAWKPRASRAPPQSKGTPRDLKRPREGVHDTEPMKIPRQDAGPTQTVVKFYRKCAKCNLPVPNGGKSTQEFCFKCRAR
jgi:hypothetical protein